MFRDLRYAFRGLVREPVLLSLAILAIAIGVGANAAIFSVVEGVLLRPLPYADPDRLVFIRSDFRAERGLPGVASAEIEDIQSQSKLIERIGWVNMPSASLTDGQQMERVPAARISGEFLPVLGVAPVLGRHFSANEDFGDVRNVMISYELWRRRYQGDSNIIGRSIEVNNSPATVVGVLPEGFRLYLGIDTNLAPHTDVWFPGDFSGATNRTSRHYQAVARMRSGVTIEQAQAEMDAIAAAMVERNPQTYRDSNFRLHVAGLQQDVVKPVRTVILVLLCAVGFVLLIACANVANLLLARATGRKIEIAIRTALGAGQLRVIWQLLTESVVLACLGGAAGLLLAQYGIDLLLYLKPENLPRQDNISLNATVTFFALGVSLLSGILFGVAPCWHVAKLDIHSALKESGRSKTPGARLKRIRAVLIAAQVAASVILIVGAALMMRTFENMRRVDLGFDPENLLTLRVDYSSRAIRGADTWRFYRRAIEAVKTQPGVESATAAMLLPFDPILWTEDFAVAENPENVSTALYNPVLPGYFQTMRIPLIAGRDFTEADNDAAAAAAIVDQGFAERTWPGQNALGKKIILHPQSRNNRKTLEVVGIAGNARMGIRPDRRPQIYVPFGSDYGFFLMMAVRTTGNPVSLAPALRRAIEEVGGKRPVWNIRTMDDYVSDATAETRFALILLTVLATVAVLLSMIGIYGVVSCSIGERIQEFAIRIALGAQNADIVRLAVTSGLVPAIAGLSIGIPAAVALTRFLQAMLFEVSPADPVTYVISASALLTAALIASYVPVRSLMLRTNPRKFLL